MPTVSSVNPGNVVVPLSAIIDQLQGKLSAADLNALLLAVVGNKSADIKPGDLITADWAMQVGQNFEDLFTRVARLESGAAIGLKPIILDVSPVPVRVGATLTVSGFNFPPDPDLGGVSLDGTAIARFATATDKQLVFTIPALTRSLPAEVKLTVGTGQLSDSTTVQVLPALIVVAGTVKVNNQTQSLPTIVIGTSYQVDFEINSITNVAETYSLKPVFSQISGTATEADWLAGTTLIDPSSQGGVVLSEALIRPGTPQAVRINFKVPAGAKAASLQLQASSKSQPTDIKLTQSSNPALTLTVGKEVVPSDPNTTFTVKPYGPAVTTARLATINGMAGVEIQFGQTQFVRGIAAMVLKGTYDYSVDVAPDGVGWVIPSQNTSISPANSIVQAGNGQEIAVSVTSTDSSSPLRTLTIVAVRRADGEGPTRTSWVDIPIRGF